jgi:glutaredoxin
MNKNLVWTLITIFLILGIVAIILVNKFSITSLSICEAKYIGNHSTLYVLSGCSHCEDQLKMFGENKKYLNIVDCSENLEECQKLGITHFPTWVIGDKTYIGTKSVKYILDNYFGVCPFCP